MASIKGAESLLSAYFKRGDGVVAFEMALDECHVERYESVEQAEAECTRSKQELYEQHFREFGSLPYAEGEHCYFIVADGQLVKTI